MSQSFKIFISCAIGAAIGAFVSLDLHLPILLGILTGGAIGYVLYEFKSVLKATASTWKTMKGWRLSPYLFTKIGWRYCLTQSLHGLIWLLWGITLLAISISMLYLALSMTTRETENENVLQFSLGCGLLVFLALGTALTTIGALASACIFLFSWGEIREAVREGNIDSRIEKGISYFREWNPFTQLIVEIPLALFEGVLMGASETRRGLRWCRSFIWTVFVKIHSERRLICGVDAALGAGIGCYAGSAIAGAIAGGLLGVANYHIVSIRWLKLVPEQMS